MSTVYRITIKRQAGGMYEYLTSNFFPIDDALLGNGNDSHNYFFTFEIAAEFTYDASAGQVLRFMGDDDVWVFIDGKLVIDLGGIAGNTDQHIDLDRLGLADGESYRLCSVENWGASSDGADDWAWSGGPTPCHGRPNPHSPWPGRP